MGDEPVSCVFDDYGSSVLARRLAAHGLATAAGDGDEQAADGGAQADGLDADGQQHAANPLLCPVCSRTLHEPVTLACRHSFCRLCIRPRHDACSQAGDGCTDCDPLLCPLCAKVDTSAAACDCEPATDPLIEFLVATATESADACANCERVVQPMHFCQTCQQTLCTPCEQRTHSARMFSSHRIVPANEIARGTGGAGGGGGGQQQHSDYGTTCKRHSSAPYILFSPHSRRLLCIDCFKAAGAHERSTFLDLDAARRLGVEKLERTAQKLTQFKEEATEHVSVQRKLLADLDASVARQTSNIRDTCEQMIQSLISARDRLLEDVKREADERRSHFNSRLKTVAAAAPVVNLYLLAATLLCSSANNIDFLHLAFDLMKRVKGVISESHLAKPEFTGHIEVECKEAFWAAVEPFLGLSSMLVTPHIAPHGGVSQLDGNAVHHGCSAQHGYKHGGKLPYVRRSTGTSNSYVNCCACCAGGFMGRYQVLVDLAGEFGSEFERVGATGEQLSDQMNAIAANIQNMQRDMTIRRCLVDAKMVGVAETRCYDLAIKVRQHHAQIQEVQPRLQQIWQEQLDRVRRQQQLCRFSVDRAESLSRSLKTLQCALGVLAPYAKYLAVANRVVRDKGDGVVFMYSDEADIAPMERICMQITHIAPDSDRRCGAIEKEERLRRRRDEQRKRADALKLANVKKQLKVTGNEPTLTHATGDESRARRAEHKASKSHQNSAHRDRSKGGTDHNIMLSPVKRHHHKNSRGANKSPTHQQLAIMSAHSLDECLLDDTIKSVNAAKAESVAKSESLECGQKVMSGTVKVMPAGQTASSEYTPAVKIRPSDDLAERLGRRPPSHTQCILVPINSTSNPAASSELPTLKSRPVSEIIHDLQSLGLEHARERATDSIAIGANCATDDGVDHEERILASSLPQHKDGMINLASADASAARSARPSSAEFVPTECGSKSPDVAAASDGRAQAHRPASFSTASKCHVGGGGVGGQMECQLAGLFSGFRPGVRLTEAHMSARQEVLRSLVEKVPRFEATPEPADKAPVCDADADAECDSSTSDNESADGCDAASTHNMVVIEKGVVPPAPPPPPPPPTAYAN